MFSLKIEKWLHQVPFMTVVRTFLLTTGLVGLTVITACDGEYRSKGGAEEGMLVEIELRADGIEAPREVEAGTVTLAIKNEDSKAHILIIERADEAARQDQRERAPVRPGFPPGVQGMPGMIEPEGQDLGKHAIQNIRSGEKKEFEVTLIPGEYRVYSPEASGELETTLTVVEKRR